MAPDLILLRCVACDEPLRLVDADLAHRWKLPRCPQRNFVPMSRHTFVDPDRLTPCQYRSYLFAVRLQEQADWRRDNREAVGRGIDVI